MSENIWKTSFKFVKFQDPYPPNKLLYLLSNLLTFPVVGLCWIEKSWQKAFPRKLFPKQGWKCFCNSSKALQDFQNWGTRFWDCEWAWGARILQQTSDCFLCNQGSSYNSHRNVWTGFDWSNEIAKFHPKKSGFDHEVGFEVCCREFWIDSVSGRGK